jgi:hypothetical protein
MSEVYQAIYDVFRNENAGHYMQMAASEVQQTAAYYQSPSAIYRPALSIDGDKWCALYGEDLQAGVCGFGDSPAQAMADFDRAWTTKLNQGEKP